MYQLIETNKSKLNQLCLTYGVERLEVFGSAASNCFDPATSDIDFLVEFNHDSIKNYTDNYFGLLESLGKLFDRPVDLVVISAIKNPYFIESVNKNRTLLYAA